MIDKFKIMFSLKFSRLQNKVRRGNAAQSELDSEGIASFRSGLLRISVRAAVLLGCSYVFCVSHMAMAVNGRPVYCSVVF